MDPSCLASQFAALRPFLVSSHFAHLAAAIDLFAVVVAIRLYCARGRA